MILARLLRRTLARGVVYCMTCNYPPDAVYRDGLKRDDFLAAIALVKDVFYDIRVKLIVSAESPPGSLLKREEAGKCERIRAMMFEFDRTASRLAEMQTRQYLELAAS